MTAATRAVEAIPAVLNLQAILDRARFGPSSTGFNRGMPYPSAGRRGSDSLVSAAERRKQPERDLRHPYYHGPWPTSGSRTERQLQLVVVSNKHTADRLHVPLLKQPCGLNFVDGDNVPILFSVWVCPHAPAYS